MLQVVVSLAIVILMTLEASFTIVTCLSSNPYRRGRISRVDLLAVTSIDKLLFILKILFAFVTKQATLIRRSTVLSAPSVSVPYVQTTGHRVCGRDALSEK
jgi:hypothetical protein